MTDFQAFKNLTPERRITELQKLVSNLKKEIENNQEDIRQAEHMLALADQESRQLEQVKIPKAPARKKEKKAVSIEELTTTPEEVEEKGISTEEQEELEKLLATSPPRSDELFHKVAHRPVEELYGHLRNIYDREKTTGIETQQDRDTVYAIRRGLEEKKKDMEGGQYKAGKKAQHLLTTTEQMANTMYHGSAQQTYKSNPT